MCQSGGPDALSVIKLVNCSTVLAANLENNPQIKKHMMMLRIIGFLVPFLIAMKKRMFVPVLMRMLPNMFGEYMLISINVAHDNSFIICTVILLKSVAVSKLPLLANCRSQFLLDRLGRCLKEFVSTDSQAC